MASKDRIARLKEDTRMSILKAALHIAKEEGWEALRLGRDVAAKRLTESTGGGMDQIHSAGQLTGLYQYSL